MVNLKRLYICGCHTVPDLVPLTALVNLKTLDMRDCSSVYDLAPLTALGNLRTLDVSDCSAPWLQLELLEAMPNLENLYTV
jgi:hypothetical protein